MKKNETYEKIDNALKVIKAFIDISGMNEKQFVNYMDKNNLWSKLDNIQFSSWMSIEDCISILASGKTKDKILSTYNKRYQEALKK